LRYVIAQNKSTPKLPLMAALCFKVKKVRLIILCTILFAQLSWAEGVYQEFIHNPYKVEKLILEYLKNEHSNTDLNNYQSMELSFNFNQGIWTASFECKEVKLSCHFGVQATNERNPKFTFYPGM
jgi:hypothetical protein